MIDLTNEATESHWRDLSVLMHGLLSQMEEVEGWALDDFPAIRDAIEEWSANHSHDVSTQAKTQANNFIRFLSFIRSKKAMLILQTLEKEAPGTTSDLLFECLKPDADMSEDRRHQQVLRDRLIAISQVGALDRMFSEERLEAVKRVIEDTAKYYGAVYENM